MEQDEFLEFSNDIRNKSRVFKVTSSIGVYDAYKWLRKNRWLDIGRPLTEHEFYSIIRRINMLLGELIVNGEDVDLPCRMGRIEIRKYNSRIELVDNKIKTNLPVDWKSTVKFWYEDTEARNNKTLIRFNQKEIYKVYYNKNKANYNNKSFYQFTLNRNLKRQLAQNIKEGKIDAFMIK